ncbi:MAG: SGNH/GDSL hydrolase family protein [Microthrixaceae bacterium]
MSPTPSAETEPSGPSEKLRGWSREHRGAAIAGATCALLLLMAIVGALVPGPDRSDDAVVVLGDSITEFGQDHLRNALGEEYQLTVDGSFGARTGDRIEVAAAIAATGLNQVVVNLGTNDVVVGTPLDKVRDDMDTLLGHLDAVECVHVVTVGENLVSDGLPLPRAGEAVNAELADVVSSHPNAQLLYWDRVQAAAAVRRGDPQALLHDGIHPDGDGLTVLAEGYRGVLGDCGRPFFLP